MNAWIRALTSTVGCKYLMGITGLLLFLFVIAHLSGNLALWSGREAMNAYAEMLQSLGPLLWAARIGLSLVFLLHVGCAISLARRNATARPVAYAGKKPIDSTLASRTMLLTGITTFAFVVFHLAHFTLGKVAPASFKGDNLDAAGRPDVWGMMVEDFGRAPISLAYVLFMIVLGLHLWHGVTSAFQSMGWMRPRFRGFVQAVTTGITALVIAGNIALPLSVLGGVVKDEGEIAKVTAQVKEEQ